MKAVRFTAYGGPEVVTVDDVEAPAAASGQVLIRVVATSVNPVDRKTREGGFQAMRDYAMPFIPGWDAAGTVEAVGDGVEGFAPGDAVYALPGARGGGWAEFVAVPARAVAPKPTSVSFAQAGALPLVALTAWQGLFTHGGLQPGQRVLIHGAAGGVGALAVQFAHDADAYVIGTASGDGVALAKSLGADEVVDHTSERFEDVARKMDLVLDLVGGETQARLWGVLRPGGILVSTVGSPPPERAEVAGVRAVGFGVKDDGAQLRAIAALVDAGRVRALVDVEMPLADASEAIERSRIGRSRGKLVLRVAEG